jgi:hypothetical protein
MTPKGVYDQGYVIRWTRQIGLGATTVFQGSRPLARKHEQESIEPSFPYPSDIPKSYQH